MCGDNSTPIWLFENTRVPLDSPTKPALIETVDPVMVRTSLEVDSNGGRLAIWKNPPLGSVKERPAHDKDAR